MFDQNIQYEIEETNNDINLRTDVAEKEEYLEIKCELISLMDNAKHILTMNDDNLSKCFKMLEWDSENGWRSIIKGFFKNME